MCAMLLADLGAEVLRLERRGGAELGLPKPTKYDLLLRNRPRISVNLKQTSGIELALELIERADIVIEGYRPGTMERIGLGPTPCLARNGRLVYGRMTGWGQEGPLSSTAGHDLNYIAISGALHAIGRKGQAPTPPLNLVGDFGGGALYLAMGVLAAVFSVRQTGKGQVVDAAMTDGAASLMTVFYGLHAAGLHSTERGTNILDSGAPFYDVYECADGKYLSVAPLEQRFRAEFCRKLGLDLCDDGDSLVAWQALRANIARKLLQKTRDEWMLMFGGSDACVAPVLSLNEAPMHPQNVARQTFIELDGVIQPAPAPRFSGTPAGVPTPPQPVDSDVRGALLAWGLDAASVHRFLDVGVAGSSKQ